MPRKPALVASIALIAVVALPSSGSASVTNTRITSGPIGTVVTGSAEFAFTSPLAGGFECRLDFGGWSACESPRAYSSLADGFHLFKVRALNRYGHPDPTPAFWFFRVAAAPPETTIVAAPSGTIATDSPSFAFESSGPGGFECRLDSEEEAAWAPCSSPQTYSGLADGPHAFEVRALSEGGSSDPTPAATSFAIDAAAPETTISSGPSGTIEADSATFAFSASEQSSFECRFDSSAAAAWTPCGPPRIYSGLAEGTHGFEVRATDEVGNVDPSPASATFAVDARPPDPVAGRTFNLVPVSGTIELQCPGEDEYSRLASFKQVPVGCLVNARRGVVDLTSSKGSSGQLQGGDFWGGVFIVSQEEGDDQEVELKLAGRRMCERRGAAGKPVAKLSRAGRKGRKLWGKGEGDYETSGSYGSATVRGTTWLVVDRCDSSTLIKVSEGTVWVRDFVKSISLTLTGGEQYLAKAAIPRLDPKLWP